MNDAYPGDCRRYIDTDNDGICDHSQLPPEERQPIAVMTVSDQVVNSREEAQMVGKRYYFLPLTMALFLSYLLSLFLVKKKIIKLVNQRKFWNILLAVSFLITLVTSLIYLLEITTGMIFTLPFDVDYWHIEFGLIFMLVGFYHFLWHWPYYRKLIS